VHRGAADVDAVVGETVELPLDRAPVEAVGPVLHQGLDIAGVQPLGLVVLVEVRGAKRVALSLARRSSRIVMVGVDRERSRSRTVSVVHTGF
jgi:hypothetical protein